MARDKLTVKTDEELSRSSPELVEHRKRNERIKRGFTAGLAVAAVATKIALDVTKMVLDRKQSR